MIKQTVYLDTSVINFLFADDAPEKQEITRDFFENFVKTGIYETYWSIFVIDEINQTQDWEQRQRLLEVAPNHGVANLAFSDIDEIDRLAQQYLAQGAIPPKKVYDALHVACCVVEKIDYLVSWNYKHLANVNRERRIQNLYMRTFEAKTSLAQLEVWEWKEKATESIAHLPVGDRIRFIIERTKETLSKIEADVALHQANRPIL